MRHSILLGIIATSVLFTTMCTAIPSQPVIPTETQIASTITPTITPTSTLPPTQTATPIPAWVTDFAEPVLQLIEGRAPDYQDDFSNPASGWHNGATSDENSPVKISGERRYDNGEYLMITNGATSTDLMVCSGGWEGNVSSRDDFVVQYDVKYVSGEAGDWHIFFRQQKRYFYAFAFSRSGDAYFMKCDPDCYLTASVWAGAIISEKDWNHVQLIARGPKMAAYVNGKSLLYVEDIYYATPKAQKEYLDLNACNPGQAPLEVRWDNFRLWNISDPQ